MSHAALWKKVRVWDISVRLFHWSLVGLIATLWYSAEQGNMSLHIQCAYAVLGLIIFRLIWGFVGSYHARFANFIRGPHQIITYLQGMKKDKKPSVGHNPLGALSVIALLGMVLLQLSTGLFATDDIFTEGPYNRLVSGNTAEILTTLHKVGFNFLLLLVVVHIAAIMFYRVKKKDNLVPPMIHGYKKLPPELAEEETNHPFAPLWLAGVVAAISAGLVYVIVSIPAWVS